MAEVVRRKKKEPEPEKKPEKEAPKKVAFPSRTIEEQLKAVSAVVITMNKAMKEGDVVVTGMRAIIPRRFPTGSKMLDAILGGGYPAGKVIEFFGEFGCGKSSTILLSIAAMQRAGLVCVLIDTEFSFDKKHALACGVDLARLILIQDRRQQAIIDRIEMLSSNRIVNAIFLDSVQGMIPEQAEDKSAYDSTMGIEAKLNNLLMRKVIHEMNPPASEPHCILVVVSQTRAVIGQASTHPLPPQPGGGQAIRFFKHVSVRLKKGDKKGPDGRVWKVGKPVCGQEIIYHTEKNKTFRPYLTGYSDFYFADAPILGLKAGQIDTVKELAVLGRQVRVIQQAGPYFELDGEKFKGEDALVAHIREMKNTSRLEKAIVEALGRGDSAVESEEE